ncbi:hypothetical protein C8J56DRAFT_853278 [Mycena floridula]|nr:hypothetical protein C8J56DRAFT_853278 [Mycena floridula]
MSLPVELLREIVHLTLNTETVSSELGTSSKRPWKTVQSLSLTSRCLRALVLKAWFQTLFILDPDDITQSLAIFPQITKSWTRSLHIVQSQREAESRTWDINLFESVDSIRCDFLKSHYQPSSPLLLSKSPTKIRSLDVRGLEWPDLRPIAVSFPELEVLHWSSKRTFCSLCNTCQPLSFEAPCPEVIRYDNGLGLPHWFRRTLAPLLKLRAVYLNTRAYQGGNTTLGNGENENPYLWLGECDECMVLMYEDTKFCEEWVTKKKATSKGQEGPPMLQLVEWRFQIVQRTVEEEEEEDMYGEEQEEEDQDQDTDSEIH